MIRHILKATIIWLLQLLIQVIGVILGLVIIPIALLKPNDGYKSVTYKSDGENEWWLRRLPDWARYWDNTIDGTLGDDDYRYASRDIPFGLKNTSFLGQYWWMAFRNPFNYFKRFIIACDVRNDIVEKVAGQGYVRDDLRSTGWQFLKCGKYYTFYGVWKWKWSGTHAVVVQLGNKFDLQDNFKAYPSEQEYKYFKGSTFEINPYKDIS
jgi:hypothetical protein